MILETILVILVFLFSFLISLNLTKWWIKVARINDLIGRDMNKHSRPEVAEAGGIAAIVSIIISILLYIFIKTFILNSNSNLIQILTLLITLLMAGFIGFIDDILGWKKGLKQWQKLLLTLPIAIPLIVINAGTHAVNIPFLGAINFGLIYPLVLIPIAIMGTTNGFNILAGYNGLEAGLGVLIFAFLGILTFFLGQTWLSLIALIILGSLLGFLTLNKYPSKVFPGDSLTYSLGALIGCFAILGNIEKIALILFIPFIIEGILKLRSRLKAENFGKTSKDNSLDAPYKKIFSLTHLAIIILKKIKPSHKVYEKDVVNLLWGFEALIIILAAFIYNI
ncbi:MAG: glycosyltransferase 4 family protein [archaeon]